jgi:hypothetical protein
MLHQRIAEGQLHTEGVKVSPLTRKQLKLVAAPMSVSQTTSTSVGARILEQITHQRALLAYTSTKLVIGTQTLSQTHMYQPLSQDCTGNVQLHARIQLS